VTLDPGTHTETTRLDAQRLAAAARSILACPRDVQLVVDGIDDVTAGLDEDRLEMQDHGGRPVFSCPADSALAVAATDRRGALLTLGSGLGAAGSPDRDATLTLSGRLEAAGLEQCECCDEVRMRIALHLDFVLLTRTGPPVPGGPGVAGGPGMAGGPDAVRIRVPLGAFTSPDHDLNRGFLQRSTEHANLCHQDELRRAIATLTQTRLGEVLGVHLTGLRADGVTLQWVDPTGAHLTALRFPHPAGSPQELGELLRSELHSGLC